MKVKWKIGACGEYFDYKGFTVIKQDHPILEKYEITIENQYSKDLIHIHTGETLGDVKLIIQNLTPSRK